VGSTYHSTRTAHRIIFIGSPGTTTATVPCFTCFHVAPPRSFLGSCQEDPHPIFPTMSLPHQKEKISSTHPRKAAPLRPHDGFPQGTPCDSCFRTLPPFAKHRALVRIPTAVLFLFFSPSVVPGPTQCTESNVFFLSDRENRLNSTSLVEEFRTHCYPHISSPPPFNKEPLAALSNAFLNFSYLAQMAVCQHCSTVLHILCPKDVGGKLFFEVREVTPQSATHAFSYLFFPPRLLRIFGKLAFG